jgi:hypothetical protein
MLTIRMYFAMLSTTTTTTITLHGIPYIILLKGRNSHKEQQYDNEVRTVFLEDVCLLGCCTA